MDREFITTLLDLAAVLLFAAGVTGGLFPYLHWWALTIGAAVLCTASWLVAARTPKPVVPS